MAVKVFMTLATDRPGADDRQVHRDHARQREENFAGKCDRPGVYFISILRV
jgi:hypothetical protein